MGPKAYKQIAQKVAGLIIAAVLPVLSHAQDPAKNGPAGSLFGQAEKMMDSFMKETLDLGGLYEDGFSFQLASSTKGPFLSGEEPGLFEDFVFNTGPEFSVFTETNNMTQDLMKTPNVKKWENALAKYDSIESIKGKDLWNPMDVITHSSLTRQFVGSYIYRGMVSEDGGYVYNMVFDSKSRHSFFLHIPSNVSRSGSKNFGNTYQFYLWVSPRKK